MRTAIVCAVGVTLMALAIGHGPANADDFGPFYRAARLAAAHSSVYAEPMSSPNPATDGRFLPFVRTPAYAAALRPLAALPYAMARRVWIAALILAVCFCVWLIPGKTNGFSIALVFSLPLLNALIVGQDITFVLLIVLAAARMFSSGREFAAGLVASLAGIKMTFLPAVGLVFLAKSRRGLAGLLTGTAIQLAISFWVGGFGWISDYAAHLRNPLFDPEPARMLNIREVVISLGWPAAVYLIASAALYLLFWFGCRKVSLTDGLMLALAVGLIASPHSKVYDGVVLIPLFVKVASLRSWAGAAALGGLTPALYLMVLMGSLPVMAAGAALLVVATIAAGARLLKPT